MQVTRHAKESSIEGLWAHLVDVVHQHGWAVQCVFGEEETPSFAYTVGLSARGLPDVILFGLEVGTARSLLNELASQLISGEIAPAAGQEVHRVATVPLKLASIDLQVFTRFALGAERFARENEHQLAALHLVYPDQAGRLPGQLGCDRNIRDMQSPPSFGKELH